MRRTDPLRLRIRRACFCAHFRAHFRVPPYRARTIFTQCRSPQTWEPSDERTCGNCARFVPVIAGDTDTEAPGQCTWEPEALPLSWRWTRREVAGVAADTDASGCALWLALTEASR